MMIALGASTLAPSDGLFLYASKQGHLLWRGTGVHPAAGLLPLAIENAFRYFPLQPGDQVLFKDLPSGGAGDEGFTLVTAVELGTEPAGRALWVPLPGTEALKMPPLPIRLGGELNRQILAALPPETAEALEKVLDREFGVSTRLSTLPASIKPTAREIEALRKKSRDKAKALFTELPWGEFKAELSLRSGETLKLNLHIEEDGLHCDFSGTSISKGYALPMAVTSGLVRSALADFFGWSARSESGFDSLIEIRVPQSCCLDAGAMSVKSLSARVGPLLTLVQAALAKLPGRGLQALGNSCDLTLSLAFDRGPLHWSLPSGAAATENSESTPSFWCRRPGQTPFSLEQLESRWPLKVLHLQERNSSAGKGRVPGGRGLHLHLQLLEDVRLEWNDFSPEGRLKTEKHQSAFDSCEILLRRDGQEQILQPGLHELRAGDELVLLSGSGGGLL